RTSAASAKAVAPHGGLGPAGRPTGKGGAVGNRRRAVGRFFRKCPGGQGGCTGRTGTLKRSRCRVWHRVHPCVLWRILACASARRRSRTAVPGGHRGQIHVPAAGSSVARPQTWRSREGDRRAEDRSVV